MLDMSTATKRYRGYVSSGGDASSPRTVTVAEDGGDERLLAHRVRHSPAGFSWGYGGSGPADLARSILSEHLGTDPSPGCYQAFKFAFAARFPQDGGWELSSTEIASWLAGWERERPGRSAAASCDEEGCCPTDHAGAEVHQGVLDARNDPTAGEVRCALCGHPIRHVGPQPIHWAHVSNGLPACAPPRREERPDA